MKVKQYKVKNHFIITDDNKKVLQSYDSIVVEIKKFDNTEMSIVLGRDWDYSPTTRRYVYSFLEDYTNINLHDITNKKKYINDLLKEYNNNHKAFIDKYNFIMIYDKYMY